MEPVAWEAFVREPLGVIVIDWMMPGLDGLDLCRKVRQRVKTDYTYFILLTAINTGRDNLRKAMDAGIDDFLTKPLDREAIMRCVCEWRSGFSNSPHKSGEAGRRN